MLNRIQCFLWPLLIVARPSRRYHLHNPHAQHLHLQLMHRSQLKGLTTRLGAMDAIDAAALGRFWSANNRPIAAPRLHMVPSMVPASVSAYDTLVWNDICPLTIYEKIYNFSLTNEENSPVHFTCLLIIHVLSSNIFIQSIFVLSYLEKWSSLYI